MSTPKRAYRVLGADRETIAEDVAGCFTVCTWQHGDDYGTTIFHGDTAIAGDPYDNPAAARLGHARRVRECRQWAEAAGTTP